MNIFSRYVKDLHLQSVSIGYIVLVKVKKQKEKNDWFMLRINCSKQCTDDFFRGLNASRKVWLIYLEVSKYQ